MATDQGQKCVYVVDAKNQVEYRRVKVGPVQSDGLRVIQEGVKAGEWVLVSGLQLVRPRMEVKPEHVTPDSSGGAPAVTPGSTGGSPAAPTTPDKSGVTPTTPGSTGVTPTTPGSTGATSTTPDKSGVTSKAPDKSGATTGAAARPS